ncbi:MAG: hypothetical protein RMK29_13570 [Myxococcales bacterium]|nr:hypothetical protein [Myxococcota bacterium]MDW8282737.1 hypothetical protein [Myxococcales bacterium]
MDAGFVETLVDHCPSWGYVPLLVLALVISVAVASAGMRVCETLLSRVRRLT